VFGVREIDFVVYKLSANGVKPSDTNKKVILGFRRPENVEEVRSFLGTCNFSGVFIPHFATIAEPLRRLTRKDVSFVWGAEQEVAFVTLKKTICSAPVLGLYDKDAETPLFSDASPLR
jgi:hypothetical protein